MNPALKPLKHFAGRPKLVDLTFKVQHHTMSDPMIIGIAFRVQKFLARTAVPGCLAVAGWSSVVTAGSRYTYLFYQLSSKVVHYVEVTLPSSL